MISLKLRNLDLVLSRHKHTSFERPVDLERLPEEQPAPAEAARSREDVLDGADVSEAGSEERLPSEPGFDALDDDEATERRNGGSKKRAHAHLYRGALQGACCC